MNLVDVLVQRTPVKSSMRPVVPCVFKHEEYGDLISDCEDGGKWDACRQAKILSHGMEQPERC